MEIDASSGNANDGEEDVPKNNVVQEFIVLHPPTRPVWLLCANLTKKAR
jgi:hypothetical protein